MAADPAVRYVATMIQAQLRNRARAAGARGDDRACIGGLASIAIGCGLLALGVASLVRGRAFRGAVLTAAGGAIASTGVAGARRQAGPDRAIPAGAPAAGCGSPLAASRRVPEHERRAPERRGIDPVEQASMESFPASDAPAW